MRASDESETGFSLLVFVQSPPPPHELYRFRETGAKPERLWNLEFAFHVFVTDLYEQAVSFGSSSVKAQNKAYIFGIKSGRRRERFCLC